MKSNIIKILLVALFLFSLLGCKKNIEDGVWHTDYLSPYMYSNENIIPMLNNCYGFLTSSSVGFSRDGDGGLLASASDEAVNSNLNSNINILINGTWSPLLTFNTVYSECYRGIRACYKFVSIVDSSRILPLNSFINRDSTIKRAKAETYFLRAYYKFELVRRYGAIVLPTKLYDPQEDLKLPRNSFDECVNSIIADCDLAAYSLPMHTTGYNAANDTKELGRATALAALALKSRILLYAASPLFNPTNDLTKWQKAADAAKVVIDKGKTSLYGNSTNWTNLFNYALAPYNNEVIFATQALSRNDIESSNAPVSYDGALGRTNPTQELVDAFEMSNGKPISDITSGYNPLNPYLNRDPRLKMSILYNGSTFKSLPVSTYVGGKDGLNININATKTGYYMKKFLSESAKWNQVSNVSVRRPWVLIRHAEILLNYAEALNEAQGPVADVYAKVNQVRTRAGMPNLPAALSQTEMRARIHNERRVELCFEEQRIFDVRRWKEGGVYFNSPVHGMQITADANGVPVSYQIITVQNRVFDESRYYLFPFPQTEVAVAAPNLVQNPGW